MRERSNAKNRSIKIPKVFLAKEQLGRIMCSLFCGEEVDDSRLTGAIPEYHGVSLAGVSAVGAGEEERFAGEHGGAESMDTSQ